MVGVKREIDDGFIPEEIPDPWGEKSPDIGEDKELSQKSQSLSKLRLASSIDTINNGSLFLQIRETSENVKRMKQEMKLMK